MSKNKPIEIAEMPSPVSLTFDTEYEAEAFDKYLRKRKGEFCETCD